MNFNYDDIINNIEILHNKYENPILKYIPKIIHLYWDYSPLSYIQYLTIKTLRELNPEWKIIIWRPIEYYSKNTFKDNDDNKNIGIDYFKLIIETEKLEIKKINMVDIGFYNDISEVFKADYSRYWMLYEYGGIWSDFDIIYNKPFEEILYNKNDIYGDEDKINTIICTRRDINYFYIGFLGASKGNIFFKDMLDKCKKNFDKNIYQSIGPVMIKKEYDSCQNIKKLFPDINLVNISENNVYKYKYEKIEDFFTKIDNLNDIIGVHWYNGLPEVKKYVCCDYDKIIGSSFYKYFLQYFINDYNKKISIVMAYHNRKDVLKFTLDTIKLSVYKNIEIIIVDDASDIDQSIDTLINEYKSIYIKLIKIKKQTKKYKNACIPYNIGFKYATGDIIIIQNPECCHIGDIIMYIVENLKNNTYFTFTCANLKERMYNDDIYKYFIENTDNFYNNITKYINKLSIKYNNSIDIWYNHNIYRNCNYHFLSAINKEDLLKLNGFDDRYAYGTCFDDVEFIYRIIKNNIKVDLIDMNNKPFCIHQNHDRTNNAYNIDLWNINKDIFKKHMNELGIDFSQLKI